MYSHRRMGDKGSRRERQGQLVSGVFEILLDKPEGLAAKVVLDRLREAVPPTEWEASDYPRRPGVERYSKNVRFCTIPFVKAGWLAKTKGTWTVTESGAAVFKRLRNDPEAFMREAVAQYKVWRRAQPDVDDEEEPDESVDESAAEATPAFEEAEETAFEEIKSYIESMAPYDFQDLVAGLLEAMGYHVLWVAPPGADRGIDVLAGSDQLGVADPRIKVQVKRRSSASDVADLRAFMAVLGARDVGIFVSTGGFTRDAENEARTHETRKLTLINLPRLLDLWVTHYDRVGEDKKRLLPLKPIFYLAPVLG
jgi:restriction system protein